MKKPYDKPYAGFISFRPEEGLASLGNDNMSGGMDNNPFPYSDESINDASTYQQED